LATLGHETAASATISIMRKEAPLSDRSGENRQKRCYLIRLVHVRKINKKKGLFVFLLLIRF
ncbi:hypothetical protein LDK77_25040, partial [Escherichia coli]|nr:hypothetical protein [Escherichia coli]